MQKLHKHVLTLLVAVLSLATAAQPTDLFISEYVEGSSLNKALEIYNGTNSPINLTSNQYLLEIYFNGSTLATTLALNGIIPAGSVFIIAHPSATLGITPDLSSTVINFNGNDAIVLKKNGVNGIVLDVIGQVGFNPGVQWGSNDTATLDRTMRRKAIICSGDITTTNTFYTGGEWDAFL